MSKIIQVIIILLISNLTTNVYAQTQDIKEKNMAQQNGYWSMDYARSMLGCANPSYGVKNVTLFNKLVAQKDKGDPNALYIYAYLLKYYNNINHRVNLTYQQSQDEAFNIFWNLSEKDHPQACDEILKNDISNILKQKKITPNMLLNKQQHCVNIALKNNLTNYRSYADNLLFKLNKDDTAQLLLQDIKELPNNTETQKAMQLYKKCAKKTGSRYCLARVTEAYYHGIGIKADKLKATAWAKLTADRSVADGPYKTILYAHEINTKLQLDITTTQSPAYKKYYSELQKLPMPME